MKLFNFNIKDRKTLWLFLCLVCVSIFTLTIAYAALNAVLTISGNAEVSSSNWDIHLEDPVVKNGSATTDVPIITSSKSLTFSTTLNMPGDFYEFTVDVVNDGGIDAMIDKVTKTPELSSDQSKYLKYEVSYQNGEAISTKQTLSKGSTMPIKVRVEYRNDIDSSSLPTGQVVLNLSIVLDYIQSDGTGTTVTNNGVADTITIVSGNINTQGSEICFGNQCFYVLSSSSESVTMLAKYNLYVGNKYINDSEGVVPLENPTGIQDERAIAGAYDQAGLPVFPWEATIAFSNNAYWSSTSEYPAYVYNSNSILYNYVENYENYLKQRGLNILDSRLITVEELNALGCDSELTSDWGIVETNSCSWAPAWLTLVSFWSGSAIDSSNIYGVNTDNYFSSFIYTSDGINGIRPVIEVPISVFN